MSGDFIGSKIIEAIKLKNSQIEYFGVGGESMKSQGVESLFPIDQINLMGFWEIIPHIFAIKKLIKKTANDIIAKNPDILITIDSPGFTYRVAREVKKFAPHIKLMHIVAPSVWAYKPSRAQKYADLYDHMLTLWPFEPKYFTDLDLDATCIGHPVFEQFFYKKTPQLMQEMNLSTSENVKVIAVTPGSRKGEIARHMPVICKALDMLSEIHQIKVIFVQPNQNNEQYITSYLSGTKIDYIFSTDRLKAFAVSDCALAKSGTNVLEIAASGTPMIVGYKLNLISFWLLKIMIKVKYASLINIIANSEIIPEYIQSDFNAKNITKGLESLLFDKEKSELQIKGCKESLIALGFGKEESSASCAATIILETLS